jgi:transposase
LVRALDERRLVFIDESFVRTGMRREYGWGPLGQRVVGTRPFKSWKTVSLVGALRLGERPLLMTHPGTINGPIYLRFVRERLVPWLRQGDIVIMDNLNIHKMALVKTAILAAGALPIYLPTYSPELNPIELLWADLKRDLRKLGINDQRMLRAALRKLRVQVPHRRISGWFRHSFAQARIN